MDRFERQRKCDICGYSREVCANGQWFFTGCYHKPYRGKWIAELEKCPLSDEAKNKLDAEFQRQKNNDGFWDRTYKINRLIWEDQWQRNTSSNTTAEKEEDNENT